MDGKSKNIKALLILSFVTSKNLWTNAELWHHLCANWHGKLICVQFKRFTMFGCWCNLAIGGPDNNYFRFPWKNTTRSKQSYQSNCCAYHWWKKGMQLMSGFWSRSSCRVPLALSQEISFRWPRTSNEISPKTLSLFLLMLSPEGRIKVYWPMLIH